MKNNLILTGLIIGFFVVLAHPAAGQERGMPELEAAIVRGDWAALASNSVDGAVGHFCKAVANGVLTEWRAMEEEFKMANKDAPRVGEFCQDILKRNPENGYVHFFAGTFYNDKGDARQAIDEYKKSAELEPMFAAAYYAVGMLLSEQGRHGEKETWLDKALSADPDFSPAYMAKGVAYKEAQDFNLAVEQFEKAAEALKRRNITSGEQMGRVYFNWGWTLVNQPSPDNERAIRVLEEAIQADPLRFEAYNELGIVYKRKGLFSDAVETYKEGIRKGDNSAMIYFNLGVAEYRGGNAEDARASLEKAVALDAYGQVGSMARQWLNQI